jgi:hypothetical protein
MLLKLTSVIFSYFFLQFLFLFPKNGERGQIPQTPEMDCMFLCRRAEATKVNREHIWKHCASNMFSTHNRLYLTLSGPAL